MLRNSTQYVCLNALAAAALLCGSPSGQAKDRQLVLVYNTSPLTRAAIVEAEREASRIFREGVIELQWQNCPVLQNESPEPDPCRGGFNQSALYVHVLPTAGGFPDLRALAHAAVAPGSGVRATVFFDRLQAFMAASHAPCNPAQMLGHVMAHEIGHLLLSRPGHTSKGIMSGPWDGKHLQQAASGELLFTPEEAATMREAVRQRARRSLAATTPQPE